MSLPEISRRCLACGAAVRPGARFCPQCGYTLGPEVAVEAARETPPAESVSEVRDTAPPWAAEETVRDEPRPLRTTRDVETFDGRATPTTRETPAPAPVPATRETAAQTFDAGARETADAGRSRRAAARVRETVMPRVEKMREEALVVLDETPDDSGLRFVLIAVVLFVLFLLFLLLSTTVLR